MRKRSLPRVTRCKERSPGYSIVVPFQRNATGVAYRIEAPAVIVSIDLIFWGVHS